MKLKITVEILCTRIITVEATSVMEERFASLQWIWRFYSEGKWKRNKWNFKDETILSAFRKGLKARLSSGIALSIYAFAGTKYLMITLWLSKKPFMFLRGKPKTDCESDTEPVPLSMLSTMFFLVTLYGFCGIFCKFSPEGSNIWIKVCVFNFFNQYEYLHMSLVLTYFKF